MLVLDDPLGWPLRRARSNAARRARQCTRTAAPLEVRTSQAAAVRVPYVGPRQPPTAASAAGARHARPCAAKRPRRTLARSCATRLKRSTLHRYTILSNHSTITLSTKPICSYLPLPIYHYYLST
eukprot:scaffold98183_cov72-Phaeocystis_antarctica.AAC.1